MGERCFFLNSHLDQVAVMELDFFYLIDLTVQRQPAVRQLRDDVDDKQPEAAPGAGAGAHAGAAAREAQLRARVRRHQHDAQLRAGADVGRRARPVDGGAAAHHRSPPREAADVLRRPQRRRQRQRARRELVARAGTY